LIEAVATHDDTDPPAGSGDGSLHNPTHTEANASVR
jgi:hypothetical protein